MDPSAVFMRIDKQVTKSKTSQVFFWKGFDYVAS